MISAIAESNSLLDTAAGCSTGAITGTESGASASTTYNFTLRVTDGQSQTADRAFSITIEVGMANSMAFN